MSAEQLAAARELGELLAQLRMARKIRQADAAARAGIARSTAQLIERGDPGRTISQVLRYLEAIAPGATLRSLLARDDPALAAFAQAHAPRRVRPMSGPELDRLDF